MKKYERLKENIDTLRIHNEQHIPVLRLCDKTEYQLIRDIISDLTELIEKIENGTLIELSVVAELIRDFVGDDCPCNFNDIDEWLPYVCEFADTTCPDGKCWEQYLKTKLKELRGEE